MLPSFHIYLLEQVKKYSLRPEKHVATVFLQKSPSGLSDRTRSPIVSSASSLSSTSSPATPATSRSSSTPRCRAAPLQPRADPPLPRAAPPLPRATGDAAQLHHAAPPRPAAPPHRAAATPSSTAQLRRDLQLHRSLHPCPLICSLKYSHFPIPARDEAECVPLQHPRRGVQPEEEAVVGGAEDAVGLHQRLDVGVGAAGKISNWEKQNLTFPFPADMKADLSSS